MGIEPKIFFGDVMHQRFSPKENGFRYGIYYLALPLSQIDDIPIARNRFGFLSFYDRDHGAKDGTNLEAWARDILRTYNIDCANGDITLVCMPRVMGYVFNPVSFWLCHDDKNDVRAVLCEVRNTFGEHHVYLCAHQNQDPIKKSDILKAKKVFHVSPFLKREGEYTFRFDITKNHFKTWIDLYSLENKKKIITSLTGKYKPLNEKTKAKAFWTYPLVTLKAIFLIHWQAAKLFMKGVKYISKPEQKVERLTSTDGVAETK